MCFLCHSIQQLTELETNSLLLWNCYCILKELLEPWKKTKAGRGVICCSLVLCVLHASLQEAFCKPKNKVVQNPLGNCVICWNSRQCCQQATIQNGGLFKFYGHYSSSQGRKPQRDLTFLQLFVSLHLHTVQLTPQESLFLLKPKRTKMTTVMCVFRTF